MKYEIYEEIESNEHSPYERKNAAMPEPGDSIIVHRLSNHTIEVVCIKDTNEYKQDTCLSCPLGNGLCLNIPMRCNKNIAFVDINVLEDL